LLLTPDDYYSLKVAWGRVELELMVCEAEDALTDEGGEVVVVAFNKDRLKMLATTFDGVGGRDVDMVLVHYFFQVFKQRYKLDVATNWRALMRIITECEWLKKQMSANPHDLQLNIECYKNDRDVAGKMKRETFKAMYTELLARAERTMPWALTVAGLRPTDVKSVELVGGDTRVPAVKQLVRKVFQQEPSTTLHQDEAVAWGCARLCVILSPIFKMRDFEVVDAQPYPIELCYDPGKGEDSRAEVFPPLAPAFLQQDAYLLPEQALQPRGQVPAGGGGAAHGPAAGQLHGEQGSLRDRGRGVQDQGES
ncbi:unnamed protein product, partial [Ixodes persulcatus]